MSYLTVVKNKVDAIFGAEALESSIASSIIEYIEKNNRKFRHMNLAFVKQLCGLKNTESVDISVLKTLQALAGDAIGYLAVGFEYVDDNEEVHNISRVQFIGAIKDGIDPVSGEPAGDLSEKVLIYYFPDKTFPKRLLYP